MFMGLTWDPPGADRTQVGPMLAPWILLSGSQPGKNLESWNVQESCFDGHLMPWHKAPQIPDVEMFLFKIAAITANSLLLYPKNDDFFYHMSQKDNFVMYIHVFNDKKHNRIIEFDFTHNHADENPTWPPLQSAYYYRHQNVSSRKSGSHATPTPGTKFLNCFSFTWTSHQRTCFHWKKNAPRGNN